MFRKVITEFTAKRAGRKDGSIPVPPTDYNGTKGQLSPFESNITALTENRMRRYIDRWEKYKQIVVGELRDLIPDFQKAIDKYESEKKRLQTDIHIPKSNWLVIFAFFGFLLLEAPMNYFAFQFLRDPGIFTWVIAIILTFMVPLAGHMAGGTLKNKQRKVADIFLSSLLLIVSVAIIIFVAKAREEHIRMSTNSTSIADLAFYIFLFGNIIIYLLSVRLGFVHGFEYPDFVKVIKRYQRKKRQFMNRQTRLKANLAVCVGKIRSDVSLSNYLAINYRSANKRARWCHASSDITLPVYFEKDTPLPIDVPAPYDTYLLSNEPGETMWRELVPTVAGLQKILDYLGDNNKRENVEIGNTPADSTNS